MGQARGGTHHIPTPLRRDEAAGQLERLNMKNYTVYDNRTGDVVKQLRMSKPDDIKRFIELNDTIDYGQACDWLVLNIGPTIFGIPVEHIRLAQEDSASSLHYSSLHYQT
jgi:hypothetical protein